MQELLTMVQAKHQRDVGDRRGINLFVSTTRINDSRINYKSLDLYAILLAARQPRKIAGGEKRRWTPSGDQDPGGERRNVKQKISNAPGGPPASASRPTASSARPTASSAPPTASSACPASSARLISSTSRPAASSVRPTVLPHARLPAVCGDSAPPRASSAQSPAHADRASSLGPPDRTCIFAFEHTLWRPSSVVFISCCWSSGGRRRASASFGSCLRGLSTNLSKYSYCCIETYIPVSRA
jgi:hypothetical protein